MIKVVITLEESGAHQLTATSAGRPYRRQNQLQDVIDYAGPNRGARGYMLRIQQYFDSWIRKENFEITCVDVAGYHYTLNFTQPDLTKPPKAPRKQKPVTQPKYLTRFEREEVI
jgi:hypothetical protein